MSKLETFTVHNLRGIGEEERLALVMVVQYIVHPVPEQVLLVCRAVRCAEKPPKKRGEGDERGAGSHQSATQPSGITRTDQQQYCRASIRKGDTAKYRDKVLHRANTAYSQCRSAGLPVDRCP